MTSSTKIMACSYAHLLQTIVITKHQAILDNQGDNIIRGKFQPYFDQPEEVRLAEAVVDLTSRAIGAIRLAVPNGEKQVWQVSQVHLNKIMDAIKAGDVADWNRLKGIKSVSNWMFENETVGKAMVAWGRDMGVVMKEFLQEPPKEDLSWMGTGV